MFTKSDIRFEEIAADPVRRRAKIVELSRSRILFFWCFIVSAIGALLCSWSGKASGSILAAALLFGVVVRLESDLRLLRVIERFQIGSNNNLPPRNV